MDIPKSNAVCFSSIAGTTEQHIFSCTLYKSPFISASIYTNRLHTTDLCTNGKKCAIHSHIKSAYMKGKLSHTVMRTVTDRPFSLCTQGYIYLLFCKTLSPRKANSSGRACLLNLLIVFNSPCFCSQLIKKNSNKCLKTISNLCDCPFPH